MTSAAKFIDDPAQKALEAKDEGAVIVAVSERKPPARAFLRNWRQIPGLSPSKKKRGIRSWYGKPQNKARSLRRAAS
jgi:hypothetical protein